MKVNDITRQAIVAAVYTAVSLLLAPISFGNTGIDVRFAEMLVVLAYFNRKYTYGLTVGCLLTNIYGAALGLTGMPDIIFGTAATLAACLLISAVKNKWLMIPIATLINAAVVGAVLFAERIFPTFWGAFAVVGVGELIVVSVGVVLVAFVERSTVLSKMFRDE